MFTYKGEAIRLVTHTYIAWLLHAWHKYIHAWISHIEHLQFVNTTQTKANPHGSKPKSADGFLLQWLVSFTEAIEKDQPCQKSLWLVFLESIRDMSAWRLRSEMSVVSFLHSFIWHVTVPQTSWRCKHAVLFLLCVWFFFTSQASPYCVYVLCPCDLLVMTK